MHTVRPVYITEVLGDSHVVYAFWWRDCCVSDDWHQAQSSTCNLLTSEITTAVHRSAGVAETRQGGQKVSAATQASQERCRRLEILIALRKMYRNVLRAQGLLAQPTPIYESEVFKPGMPSQKRKALEHVGTA